MGMIGGQELLLILVIVILLFGAKKIPELARGLGTGLKEFKKAQNEPLSEEKKEVSEKK
jgi:sec-independent protein translocase protein TatA